MRHLAQEKPVPKSKVVEKNNWLQLELKMKFKKLFVSYIGT